MDRQGNEKLASGRPRAGDLGILIGALPTGRHNAITDVAGVRAGHVTLIAGEGPLATRSLALSRGTSTDGQPGEQARWVPGVGPVRTGVTAILPHPGDLFLEKVAGCVHVINGFGEVTNAHQVDELGVIEGPIMITNTFNVPLVEDAVIQWALARNPEMGVTTWGISPIVAECSDMFLNDIRGRHVRAEHVFQAIETATDGPVAEGAVGAGTGMTCYGFKGGVGTASRVIPEELGGYTVGVLMVTNFGYREMLTIDGVPVGRELMVGSSSVRRTGSTPDHLVGGSCVIVVATDAPLDARMLRRLAVRVTHGLARTGSIAGTTSGDFVIAFSTTNRVPPPAGTPHAPEGLTRRVELIAETPRQINALFQAVVEATEEAVLNSLFKAETMVGRDGNTRWGIPIEEVVAIMRRYGRAVGMHPPGSGPLPPG